MKKILIVDDEKMVVQVLRAVLEDRGYSVLVAMDGVQAIMQATKNRPDLIILDIMMPAGGGITVYNRLKQSVDTQNIPVIFLTAMPPQNIEDQLPANENVIVYKKPWKQKTLLSLIEKVLAHQPIEPTSSE